MKRQLFRVAKEFGVHVADVVEKLKTRGIVKKAHSFETLTDEEYEIVKALFASSSVVSPAPTEASAPQPSAPVTPPPAPAAPKPPSTTPTPPTQPPRPPTPQAEPVRASPAPPTAVLEAPKPQPKVEAPPPKPKIALPRPPVVTILGHVDHGKTTLLDYIRKTRVAAGEAGGITQSIGAYQAEYKNKKITFIDTPGHKAFANMRARGASVTDIAVLVVAADDGVMEQTREAISHARAAKVPIIVAINKIDKPGVSVQRVMEQLAREGLQPEEWGGETITVPLSALTGKGVDDLLEMILLVAELQDLRADPTATPWGVVIESYLDAARGPVATVIVKEGTLRERDVILCHTAFGRIRALLDDRGRRVSEAPPGSAVQVLGLSEVPAAGERFERVDDLVTAKRIAETRAEELRRKKLGKGRITIQDALAQQAKKGVLQIILKADSFGTLEAVESELKNLKVDEARLEFLHTGVGNINESDVLLASAVKEAVIIGFRVSVDAKAAQLAEQEGIAVRTYEIIYQITEDVQRALQGLVAPQVREVKVGEAEVRQIFKIPNVGIVAGCYVKEGQILREARVRVWRNGALVFEGTLASLKRYEEDVRKVEKDKECGLRIAGFDKVQVGDLLEFYTREVVPRI
ncbi:MAG: translation initiation factor IF-2 [Candidatus Bipolaricaulota bacterium]|nr:translation initiation factor IF-2 [Candidatus Bipolaricaulota bacterium]